MATKTAILSVKIVSDAKDFSKKMDQSAGKLDKFQSSAKKLAVPAAGVLGGLTAIATKTAKFASEAQQNFGAVDAVFKDHAGAVKDMAKRSAETLGLSGSDYAKYSALLGSQLKNAGVPMDQLAGQTNKLIGYGADFAAQFGGTVPEAVEALSSALKGEMDPIEKYGITLNQSAIDAELAAMGLSGLEGAAAQQAKTQAIMNIIQRQGADAMGAFGREAGTAAGQQAIMTAKWEDAAAKLGTALLPAMTTLADVASKVATWISENQGLVTALAIGIGILAVAILAANAAMWLINANPIALAIGAIILLVAGFVAGIIYLATQTKVFQTIWAYVMGFVKTVTAQVTTFFSNAWKTAVAIVTNVINGVRNFISGAVNNIRNAWNAGFNFIRNLVTSVVANITARINAFRSGVGSVVNSVRSFFSSAFNSVRSIVTGVISGIISTVQRISSSVSGVVNSARNAFSGAFNTMRSIAQGAINGVISAINGISGAVQGAISWVRSLFNMGGMPGWMSKLFGGGGTGFDFTGTLGIANTETGIGATGGFSLGNVFSGRAAAPTVNNYNITVNGFHGDRSALVRELKREINKTAQRNGTISVGEGVW